MYMGGVLGLYVHICICISYMYMQGGYWDYMYTSVYVYLVCICRGGTGVICTHLYTYILYVYAGASQVTLEVKNLPADAGDTRDPSWIPGSGRSSGEGCGNSLQDSCLENPMDRGAWWATVHGVPKGQTQQKRLSTHICLRTSWVLTHR